MSNYFKNVELADCYSIGESTVRNWIKLAKDGRLPLKLQKVNGRVHIAKLNSNIEIIEKLLVQNKKYRNSRAVKTISPKPEFYRVFQKHHIHDLIRSLELYKEVPLKFTYFRNGAKIWDEYVTDLYNNQTPSIPVETMNLLRQSEDYIFKRLSKYQKVNFVDIGVGNAIPIKEILGDLIEQCKVDTYTAIDLSPDIIKIATDNIKKWFGDKIRVQSHICDIEQTKFDNLFHDDYLKPDSKSTVNLVTFLGSTPTNFRDMGGAFKTISDSLRPNDLLLYSDKIERNSMTPEWLVFDFNSPRADGHPLTPRHRIVFDLLNLDDSFFDSEVIFDEQKIQRHLRVRLKFAINLKFELETGERTVSLNKGDVILVWRSYQTKRPEIENMLENANLKVIHSSLSDDYQYLLTISELADPSVVG